MTNSTENPYQSPTADLVEHGSSQKIFQFKRFSAWGVFGLGIITLGIYTAYWLVSRSTTTNAIHENKISPTLTSIFIGTTILSFLSGLLGESDIAVAASILITLAYLVSYVMVAFKLRNRLREMMEEGSTQSSPLSGVLTFLFSAIYLQYKINQYIDTKRVAQQA